MARDIWQGTLDIEFEGDWPVGLGTTLISGIFQEKADSVILLGFECAINLQNLIKIVGAIFDKIKIFYFFSRELPLILGVGRKLKKRLEIFTWRPYISNLNEIGQLV